MFVFVFVVMFGTGGTGSRDAKVLTFIVEVGELGGESGIGMEVGSTGVGLFGGGTVEGSLWVDIPASSGVEGESDLSGIRGDGGLEAACITTSGGAMLVVLGPGSFDPETRGGVLELPLSSLPELPLGPEPPAISSNSGGGTLSSTNSVLLLAHLTASSP